MPLSRIRPAMFPSTAALLAASISIAAALLALPEQALALHCRASAHAKLLPVDPAAAVKIRGKVAAISCSDGSTLLEFLVRTRQPDGTAYVPALPGLQPVLGDFFYLAKNKGIGEILNVSVDQMHGRTVSVYDQDFNEVLSVVFP